ncbi:hypothetical protein ACIOKD_14695 [Streptomyces sp. NPDC087844]|uniref:hypothetical protein n=1 Tax=Streptomyces sp. NPDC087844 TaxID=3365805 RepID=UPI00380E7340
MSRANPLFGAQGHLAVVLVRQGRAVRGVDELGDEQPQLVRRQVTDPGKGQGKRVKRRSLPSLRVM